MNRVRKLLVALWKDESGSVLGEYGIWIVLIIVVAAAALTPLGNQLKSVFKNLCTTLGGTC